MRGGQFNQSDRVNCPKGDLYSSPVLAHISIDHNGQHAQGTSDIKCQIAFLPVTKADYLRRFGYSHEDKLTLLKYIRFFVS